MSSFTANFLKTLSLPRNFNLFVTFPRLKEEKTRSYTTFVMTLMAITIFGFFAINPTLGTIIELNKQLADNKYVDQQFVQKISNLSNLQSKYSKLTSDVPLVLNAIPSTPNIPTFLAKIQAVAGLTSIQLTRLQIQPVDISNTPQAVTDYLSFSFSIVGSGTLEQVNSFISGISNFDRLITIDNISIARDQAQGSSQAESVRLDIKGRSYFKNLPI